MLGPLFYIRLAVDGCLIELRWTCDGGEGSCGTVLGHGIWMFDRLCSFDPSSCLICMLW
nr:hypothetical protein Q903MT_gene6267 [Picea sitchensis]